MVSGRVSFRHPFLYNLIALLLVYYRELGIISLKKAILIAMADEEPFSGIKKEVYPKLVKHYSKRGYETFFVYGRMQNKLEKKFRRSLEQLRWNRFHLILRLYDFFALGIYKWIRPRCFLSGQNIFVNLPEDIRHLSIKMLSALFLLDEMSYDIIVRTTASSILDLEVIDSSLQNGKYDREIYGGRINQQADGFKYVSGSLTVFNSRCVALLKNNVRKFDFSLIDDVSIGKLMIKLGVTPSIRLNTLDIANNEGLAQLRGKTDVAQIRCKSGVHAEDRIDSALMMAAIEMLDL